MKSIREIQDEESKLDQSIQMSNESKNRIYNNIMNLIETRKEKQIIRKRIIKYSFATLLILCILSISIYSYKSSNYLNKLFNQTYDENIYSISYELKNNDTYFCLNEMFQASPQIVLYASANSQIDISHSFSIFDSNNEPVLFYLSGYESSQEENEFLIVINNSQNTNSLTISLKGFDDTLKVDLKNIEFAKSAITQTTDLGDYSITEIYAFESQLFLYVMPSSTNKSFNTLNAKEKVTAIFKYLSNYKLKVTSKDNNVYTLGTLKAAYNNYDGSYLTVFDLENKINPNSISTIYLNDTQIK